MLYFTQKGIPQKQMTIAAKVGTEGKDPKTFAQQRRVDIIVVKTAK
jgi:hypothetical protein